MGSEILIRLSTESPYGGSCFVRLPQERERGFVYADPMIDAHRDLPVYCSDIVDSWRTAGDDK
jgi:hypothetical protein